MNFITKGQPFIGLTFGDWLLVLISVGLLAWLVPKWWRDERRFWRKHRDRRARTEKAHRFYQGDL